MAKAHPELDQSFIEEQRRRLQQLQRETRRTQAAADREERQLQQEWREPRDIADHGTDVARQDLDDAVQRTEAQRLTEIERALEKIDDGTYGLSEDSGEPISRERLEAKPEALRTIDEEREAARR